MTLFSVTDHDTLSSLPAAFDAAYERGLAFIPGVEISTEGDEDIHILGYGVDPEDEKRKDFLRQSDEMRLERNKKSVAILNKLGIPLDWDEIRSGLTGTVGRLHIARALREKGFVQSEDEAFSKYLGKGRPACVPRETPAASRAISLLRSRGVVPVLAPLAYDGAGHLLNTNADTIAAEAAKALVERFDVTLVYCFEKKGVLADASDEESVIPLITRESYGSLVASGVVSGGMVPKLDNAFSALDAGVSAVRITCASAPDAGTIVRI